MQSVDDIKRSMLEILNNKILHGDLDYITEALLEERRAAIRESTAKQAQPLSRHQGNHFIDDNGSWSWENAPGDGCGRVNKQTWTARPGDTYGIIGNCAAGYWLYNINIV